MFWFQWSWSDFRVKLLKKKTKFNHPSMCILVIVCMFFVLTFCLRWHGCRILQLISSEKWKSLFFSTEILSFTSLACDPFNRWMLNFISPFVIISAVQFSDTTNCLLGQCVYLFTLVTTLVNNRLLMYTRFICFAFQFRLRF